MGTTLRYMGSKIKITSKRAYSATYDACKASGLGLKLGEVDEASGTADGLYYADGASYPDGEMSYDDADAVADVCAAFDPGTRFTWFDEDDFSFQRVEKTEGGKVVARSWYPTEDEIPFPEDKTKQEASRTA